MTSFTTRVELHDAVWNDYLKLYQAMTAEGFVDVIRATGGQKYKMLPGDYDIESNLTRQQVLDKAKAAATKTGKSFAVFVTESAGQTWYGLPIVQEQAGAGLGAVRR